MTAQEYGIYLPRFDVIVPLNDDMTDDWTLQVHPAPQYRWSPTRYTWEEIQ